MTDLQAECLTIINQGFPPAHPLGRSLVERAMRYACEKHATQLRDGRPLPYFYHLVDVGVRLVWADQDAEVVAAGFLHDVIEDQGVTKDELIYAFGLRVARLVGEVTKITTKADGKRDYRSAIERAHLAQISPDGKTIKLADVCSNVKDILIDKPSFAPVYLEEKRLLLPVLSEGHPALFELANQFVTAGLATAARTRRNPPPSRRPSRSPG